MLNKVKIHPWDLGISVVEINKDFSKLLKSKISRSYGSLSELLKSSNFNFGYTRDYTKYLLNSLIKYLGDDNPLKWGIPIKILYELCKTLDIDQFLIEKNLITVKPSRSKIFINKPVFPIEINPIITSLLFHFYGDGSHENWCQSLEKHPLNRIRFFQKIEFTLGKISNWDSKNTKESGIYIPRILYKILSKLFNVPETLDKNKPPSIEHLSKDCLLSALVSIIIDEGHIANPHYEIRILQKHRKLLKVFHKICKLLDYEVSNIMKEKDGKFYSFKIKFFGVVKFYKDVNKLCNKFGEILDIGDKQIELENLMNRIGTKLNKINNRISKGYHSTIVDGDIKVLKLLKNTRLTRRKLEQKLQTSFNEAHKRLGTLKQNRLVKVIGFKNKAHVYKITFKGKNLLDNWKSKAERNLLLKRHTIKVYSSYTKLPTIREICNQTPGLHVKKFYKLWESKREFENDLRGLSHVPHMTFNKLSS